MTIEYSREAEKQLEKLDASIRRRILKGMHEIKALDNPRSRGKALTENLAGLWRYRIGDYRVICDIQDDKMVILVVNVGHRKDIYVD